MKRAPRSSTSPESATYVFCLVEAARAPRLRGVPASIPGAGAVRLMPFDRGLWAVVADAPLDRFSEERLNAELQDLEAVSRHALAHATVIEFFFRRGPVIPLKIFTLFSADQRLRDHLGSRRAKLRRLFAQLRGLEEWGVRIFAGEPPVDPAPVDSGRTYLERKKRITQRRGPSRSGLADANKALKALGRAAQRTRKESYPRSDGPSAYLAGASFLVKTKRRAQWRKQVAGVVRSLAEHGHRLEMSGPWPPYHFASG